MKRTIGHFVAPSDWHWLVQKWSKSDKYFKSFDDSREKMYGSKHFDKQEKCSEAHSVTIGLHVSRQNSVKKDQKKEEEKKRKRRNRGKTLRLSPSGTRRKKCAPQYLCNHWMDFYHFFRECASYVRIIPVRSDCEKNGRPLRERPCPIFTNFKISRSPSKNFVDKWLKL